MFSHRKTRVIFWSASAFLTIGCALFPAPLVAQSGDSLSVTVTPPLIQLTIGPGEKWTSALKVVNANSYDVAYVAEVVNFESEGEGGGGKLSPVLSGDEASSHSLAAWIAVSKEPFVVPAGTSAEVPFTVNIPTDASPGGHYAAILIGTQSGNGRGAGASLSISSFVSSLIFVRIQGDVVEAGRIREFRSVEPFYDTAKADFLLRFENTGNTHLRPQGDITLYNMWGKERGKLEISHKTNLGNVLPKSVRRFEFSWEGEMNPFDIGRYSAIVTLSYGEDSKHNVSASTFFWVIPIVPVSVGFGSVLFFILLMTWFIRRYIRRALTIEKARVGTSPETEREAPGTIGVLVEPLKEGVIDLRRTFSSSKGTPALASNSSIARPAGSAAPQNFPQFFRKYRLFFIFLIVLVAGVLGGWRYFGKVLVPERQFQITDVSVVEENLEQDIAE